MTAISMSRALREGALWVLGALALILLAALVTYDPGDPGYTDTGAGGAVTNAIGPVGAWISNLFYFLFGKPSFLFPLMLAYAGWIVIRPRSDEALTRTTLLLRIGGFVLTLASSAALATLHFSSGRLPGSAGGVLGSALGLGLAHALSFLGATVLLLALWLAGVSLFLGVSWLAIMDGIGHGVLNGVDWLRGAAASLRLRREGRRVKQARADFVSQETKKKAQRPALRIEPVLVGTEPSERLQREKQVPLFEPPAASELPPLSLLDDPPPKTDGYSEEALEAMSRQVELKLADFGIEVEVVSVSPGPVDTRFELKPAAGVKVARISSLSKDLARALSAISVRVVEVIPGKWSSVWRFPTSDASW